MYKYEMHQHTGLCSACSGYKGEDIIKNLKELGFSGTVITDHFYHGNTRIDKSLPWEEFVEHYKNAYLLVKKEGEKQDIDVFFGMEENIGDGKEVLLYGLYPDTIAAHPEIRNLNGEQLLKSLYEIARDNGGLIFQAHPFRDRDYIKEPNKEINEKYLNGVEGYNKYNPQDENEKAVEMAKRKNLPIIAGSDSHGNEKNRFGIKTKERIKTNQDLVKILKEQNYELYLG